MPEPEPRTHQTLGARLTEQAAWLDLLLRHLCGEKIRRSVDLEDLAQEVYVRVLQNRQEPPAHEPGEAALRRYLVRVARSTVYDVLRALRARKRQGRTVRLDRSSWSRQGEAEGDVPFRGPGPSTEAMNRERRLTLEKAFDRLSPDQRRVIGLRQFEGRSAAEASKRMGRSETAVHSLYRRALQAWSLAMESGIADETPP